MSKTVLITGGAGFIGHHLVEELLEKTDYNVISLDRLDTSGNLRRIEEVIQKNPSWPARTRIVWHDLKAPLNEMVRKELGDVNYVLHLAAGSHVDRSIDNPMEFVMDNVVGTANILDYAREHLNNSLELFLYFSTDEVFGPAPPGVFYEEDDRYRSGNPYAASKAGAEELCIAYENTYKMPIIVSHTMNVFGLRQHPEKFIPLIIKRIRDGEKIFVHANSDCTEAGSRHYIHASDVSSAVLFLLENGVSGEKYNVAGLEETNNEELVNIIADIMGKKANYELIDFHSSRPGHDLRYALSSEKMKNLGWTPNKSVRERLREVVSWSLENSRWIGD
jgi:dTDP-glucose 4,6-dehydratase